MKNQNYFFNEMFNIAVVGNSFMFTLLRKNLEYREFITIKELKHVIKKLEKAKLENDVIELKELRGKLLEQNRSLKQQLKNKGRK